jgi:ubiquinone/menaquinone biosynthesis C-methylase UbiE
MTLCVGYTDSSPIVRIEEDFASRSGGEHMLEERKLKERELHDLLQGDLSNDPKFTSNFKYYSISQTNRHFVENWLTQRCAGKHVLDYCCGAGDYALLMAEVGAKSWGIDISPVSVERAQSEARRRNLEARTIFATMDGEATAFTDNHFDLIVESGVLHHLDLERAYRELARILKPTGEIICIEALRHNVFIHLYRKLTPHLRTAWETDHILGRTEIRMAEKYFNKVQVANFFHLATIGAVPFRNSRVFYPLLQVLEGVDSALLRCPVIKWQAWMVVFILSQPKKQQKF